MQKHDRQKFEIYAYSFGPPDKGPERRRFIEAVDHFADIQNLRDEQAAAQAEIAVMNTMMQSVNSQLAVLGGHSLRLETHAQFIIKLQDSLSLGVGSLVDADLVRESARLQAVQIQQQLATQALQIANNHPQQILALFRN